MFGTLPHLLHRRQDPDTSRAAAYSINTPSWERKVFMANWYRKPHGMTTFECLAHIKGSTHQTVSARWSGLRRKSLVYDSRERRPGSNNRKQIVWKINPFVTLSTTGEIELTMNIERLAKDETPPLDDKWQPIDFNKAWGIFEDNFVSSAETLKAIDAGREVETNFFYYRKVIT